MLTIQFLVKKNQNIKLNICVYTCIISMLWGKKCVHIEKEGNTLKTQWWLLLDAKIMCDFSCFLLHISEFSVTTFFYLHYTKYSWKTNDKDRQNLHTLCGTESESTGKRANEIYSPFSSF